MQDRRGECAQQRRAGKIAPLGSVVVGEGRRYAYRFIQGNHDCLAAGIPAGDPCAREMRQRSGVCRQSCNGPHGWWRTCFMVETWKSVIPIPPAEEA